LAIDTSLSRTSGIPGFGCAIGRECTGLRIDGSPGVG
jgi:hypothetical protein